MDVTSDNGSVGLNSVDLAPSVRVRANTSVASSNTQSSIRPPSKLQ
jgi:hypothetical protein